MQSESPTLRKFRRVAPRRRGLGGPAAGANRKGVEARGGCGARSERGRDSREARADLPTGATRENVKVERPELGRQLTLRRRRRGAGRPPGRSGGQVRGLRGRDGRGAGLNRARFGRARIGRPPEHRSRGAAWVAASKPEPSAVRPYVLPEATEAWEPGRRVRHGRSSGHGPGRPGSIGRAGDTPDVYQARAHTRPWRARTPSCLAGTMLKAPRRKRNTSCAD